MGTSKKKKKNILKTLENIFFWLGTGGIIVLFVLIVIRLTNNNQSKINQLETKLEQLEQQRQKDYQQYQLQEKNLISLSSLENNPKIHSFFTDLLTNYAEKFAKHKQLDTSHLPLEFGGLYSDPKTGNGYGEMGRCCPREIIYPYKGKEVNISLNRLYLLNKLGHDKYFTSNPAYGDYYFIDISFNKMLETISHELAHYFQLVKHGKSSCESDLVLNNGKYDKELAKEHEEWTKEIYQLIKNSSEYSELEEMWKNID